MSEICWYCQKEVGWENDGELEKHCVNCGVLNDRNPYPPVTETKEEEVKPIKHENKDFEKVVIGEMIQGVIVDIQYDKEHKFKGYQGKEDSIQMGVRFKFDLEGCQYSHYSRWLKFSYAEKSNLYKIFIAKLVENPAPDMDLDLDLLKGIKVKTLWNENGGFQNLESIFPAGSKVKATDPLPTEESIIEEPENEA